MYDFIGDIHGHADDLEALLIKLGYHELAGVYRHQSRKIIYLGDFIDRGPKISRVLEIARRMVEEDEALAVLGNHELNALAYHTHLPHNSTDYLRPHTAKNTHQHEATLKQLSEVELNGYLEWFRSLPFWIEREDFRVVHACWDPQAIAMLDSELRNVTRLDDKLLARACLPDGDLFEPIEILCKGKEVLLPKGQFLTDKDGTMRNRSRIRWSMSPDGLTYKQYAFDPSTIDFDQPLEADIVSQARPYSIEARPVFIGHYWLRGERPELLAPNVACLDYSVAKNGFLCAYRWDGEQTLCDSKWVW